MKKTNMILTSGCLLVCVLGASLAAAESNHEKSPVVIPPAAEPAGAKSPNYQVEPFALGQVKLLPSEFSHARDLNAAYLLQLDPDRFMALTREMCGLKPKKESYGGWEKRISEMGHYISACALQYAASGDERYKQRVDTMVAEMAEAQQAAGDGFVGCISRDKFELFVRGEDVPKGGPPWYYLHKQYAGLIDAYELAGNQQALEVVVKFADWADGLLSRMNDQQIQKMLKVEHGGMIESLVEIYRLTGNDRYLKTAGKFHHRAVFDPIAAGKGEVLAGLHANTQIPKFIGLMRRYQITGNEHDRKTAEFFFRYVLDHHTFANGGNSASEHFRTPDKLAAELHRELTETCNTYNMLKLARLLFLTEPRAELMDYYEHALYNHILASQHPESGMFTYKYMLYGGYPQAFSTPFDSFWCCVGSGMENHTKYMQNIFFHDEKSLWVNLFIPSELDWKARGLKVRLETQYPDKEDVALSISAASPTPLTLRLRWPAWAQGAVLKVNGETQSLSGSPGQYVAVTRTWSDGDNISWHLPMRAKVKALPDDPNKVALTYGPVTLAAALGRANIQVENLQGRDVRSSRRWDWPLPKTLPVLTALDRPVADWLQPVAGKPLTFQIPPDAVSEPVTLVACWRANTQRYAQYLDAFSAADWKVKKDLPKPPVAKKRGKKAGKSVKDDAE
jgi:uncharacterized protein